LKLLLGFVRRNEAERSQPDRKTRREGELENFIRAHSGPTSVLPQSRFYPLSDHESANFQDSALGKVVLQRRAVSFVVF
jgi:hypothetical protein